MCLPDAEEYAPDEQAVHREALGIKAMGSPAQSQADHNIGIQSAGDKPDLLRNRNFKLDPMLNFYPLNAAREFGV